MSHKGTLGIFVHGNKANSKIDIASGEAEESRNLFQQGLYSRISGSESSHAKRLFVLGLLVCETLPSSVVESKSPD